ncbi:MAG: NAD+ synthase [Candidatus Lokiarchaeota archaeon]|nr:NAD+ synthase [Candidatus Lokiarchaeota archaeon]MBD3340616.1 NAD+ synthase [Candidatus Lokiarchaeota archaeon]
MPQRVLKLVLGQINPIVGDIEYNRKKVIDIVKKNQDADIIIFPEMSLVGYPLMDHIHDPLIRRKNLESIELIKELNSKAAIILGTFTEPPELREKIQKFYNSAIVIQGCEIKYIENKRLLPNYDVFDERRYFSFDNKFIPVDINGVKVGILICEDIWDKSYNIKVGQNLVDNGAELLIVINASPYYISKFKIRKDLICEKSKKLGVPIAYINLIGGLDEIVFDGQSFVSNKFGQITYKSVGFQEASPVVRVEIDEDTQIEEFKYNIDWRKEVLEALKLNLYDYFHKTGIFEGVVLGLSGGIDSAFTSYICAKALGSDKVTNIMMPTRFTSEESINLARRLCENLNMNYIIHPIDDLFEAYEKSFKENIGDLPFDVADENLQARVRAVVLMYYSNKFNWLLVSTGNKSEIGVGYCTLYGDTNGGKNIPGDLLKVQIYDICEYINKDGEVIPQGIISRPPTAELREDQKDSDSLPPYPVLDQILKEIIEHGIGDELNHLRDKGIDQDTINRIRKLYLNSEFKRRQLVQTIKVSASAFGIGRRYPVLKKLKF